MKTLLPLLCGVLLLSGCNLFKRPIDTNDAPRAIPVKPVIRQLDLRIDRTGVISDDISQQAKDAYERGLAAKSKEAAKLVESANALKSEVAGAKKEIATISERSDAMERERDHFSNKSKDLGEDNRKLEAKVTKADATKWFWIKYSIVTSALILLWLTIKILRSKIVQGYINPYSLITPR